MKIFLTITILILFTVKGYTQDYANSLFNLKFSTIAEDSYKEMKNTDELREQFSILSIALGEINLFKYKAFEEGTVFTKKELKKVFKKDQLDDLQEILKEKSDNIKIFLGQTNQFGLGKDECLKYYSNLKICMSSNDFESANDHWRELYTYYPRFQNFYQYGEVLITKKIEESLGNEKDNYVDSLLSVFDQRIKYFSDDPNYGKDYLLGRKGGLIYKYKMEASLEEAYSLLKQSIENQKENSKYSVVKDFFDATMSMLRDGIISPEEMVNNFTTSIDILKENTKLILGLAELESYKDEPDADLMENWKKEKINNGLVSDYISKYFASAEESKCEYLIPQFKIHFPEHKQDKEWLNLVTGILFWKECTDNQFYGDAAKSLYKLDPSANSAFKLALYFLKKKNYKEASKYIKEAYTQETEREKKSEYYYFAAVISFAQNQYSNARKLANNSLRLNKNNGKPYVLIAKLYAASTSTCGKDKFEKSAIYWLAVDKLISAKSIDKSVINETKELQAKYEQRYPSNEELFMRGLYEGDSYKIECWINESTFVKLRK